MGGIRGPVRGARLYGGRWSPRGVFAAIYLAQPLSTCLAELERQSDAANLPVLARIARGVDLHTLAATDIRVLDLREVDALDHVGLSTQDIVDEDWTACQAVGHAAYFLDHDGLLAPSASGTGLVVTVFETRLGPGQLVLQRTEPLTEKLYRHGR